MKTPANGAAIGSAAARRSVAQDIPAGHSWVAHVTTTAEPGQPAPLWVVRCGRHDYFVDRTYEAVEDAWRAHIHAATGALLPATGHTEGPRWAPTPAVTA